MTKYEILYGVSVSYFPNEEENVRKKLKLVNKQIGKFYADKLPHTYENQCVLHELNQAKSWCEKILSDISS